MGSDYGVPLGIMIGAAVALAVISLMGVLGDSDWVQRYDGIKDKVAEMRYECETLPDVADCVWDADKRDFVPESS